MAFIDRINPEDNAFTRLSKAPDLEQMPGVVLCPSEHRAYLQILILTDSEHGSTRVPVYGCVPCGVVYRYQECPRLPPGEEGHPSETV
jgi:hypothetical protein